jgi:hypothetical protein
MFCLANLYVEGAVGYVDPTPTPPIEIVRKMGPMALWKYDANYAANPMGRLAVGHEWNPSAKVRVDLEIRHESWLGTTADHGQNSIWFSTRILPFRWEPK